MDGKERRYGLGIALSLTALAVGLRLLPHPANFAPVAAVAIFGGATLPRRLAVWLPVAVMVLSDAIIGFYDYRIMAIVWASYLGIAFASSSWLRGRGLKAGMLLTIAGSTCFFLMTNFAVWLWSGMYAHDMAGLMQCYAMALPFFRNTFVSDAFYTVMLFGVYSYATRIAAHRLAVPAGQISNGK